MKNIYVGCVVVKFGISAARTRLGAEVMRYIADRTLTPEAKGSLLSRVAARQR